MNILNKTFRSIKTENYYSVKVEPIKTKKH